MAARAILNATSRAPVVLVAWEHLNIHYLAADLGVDKSLIPRWADSDYDTVYVLHLRGASVVNFTIAAQNFTAPARALDEVEVAAAPPLAEPRRTARRLPPSSDRLARRSSSGDPIEDHPDVGGRTQGHARS